MKLLVNASKWILILTLGIVAARHGAAAPTATPLYWHHFVGTAQVAQNPEAGALKQVAALPETAGLKSQVMAKLTAAAFTAWKTHLPADADNPSELWQPLWKDAFTAESVVDVRSSHGNLEATVALKLSDTHAGVWNTNLTGIVRRWKLAGPKSITVHEAPGWEARHESNGALLQVVRAGPWIVLGLGPAPLTQLPVWVETIGKTGHPASPLQDNLGEARINFPRIKPVLPAALAFLNLPPAQLHVSAKEAHLRTHIQLDCPNKIDWKPEAWLMPTNIIGEPIISFTVAQGLAPLLERLQGFSELGLGQTPNQVCLWGQANPHVQTCATVPVQDATNTMLKLSQTLPPFMKEHPVTDAGNYLWISNRHSLVWQAAPFVFPTLVPYGTEKQDYLLGAFFPVPPEVKPAPPALFDQVLGRRNLLYYDWELTSERLPQMSRLWQLYDIAHKRMVQKTNAVSFQWLQAIAPLAGNTVTEITRTGDQQVTFLRKSKLGLTGFELVALTRWLDSPGFPLQYQSPPLLSSVTNQVKTPKVAPRPPPKPRIR